MKTFITFVIPELNGDQVPDPEKEAIKYKITCHRDIGEIVLKPEVFPETVHLDLAILPEPVMEPRKINIL